jgi:integrase
VKGYLSLAAGHVADGKLSSETAERYQTSIVLITLALAGEPDADGHTEPVPLSAITTATLLDFVEARREEERASSTILNDLTAWSRVLAYAAGKNWIEHNVVRSFDRRLFVGKKQAKLNPPTDEQVAALMAEVGDWRADMGLLIHWLRETGMRLAEALQVRAEDIHPDRQRVTLSRGVKGWEGPYDRVGARRRVAGRHATPWAPIRGVAYRERGGQHSIWTMATAAATPRGPGG